jgi:hypothetical protein
MHFEVSLFPFIYSPGVGNTLGGCVSNLHLFALRWQHARGLRLELASIHPALATRSGAAPRIGIYSPGVGNMLGGCASRWYLFVRRWQHARGLRLALVFVRPALATRSGAAPYAVNLNSLLNHRRCSVYCADFSSAYSASTPKTLHRVDSGPPRRLHSTASTPFGPCQPSTSNVNLFAYDNQTLGGSTTTSPLMICETASV